MPLKATWIYDIFYNRSTWCVPYVPVVDCFAWLEAHKAEGFAIAGVYGNNEHWNKKNAGGHTNRSTHALWGVLPKATHTDNVTRRYVPAIDYKLPDAWMARYQAWYIKALRANRFPYIQYVNINGHHYNRASGYAQESSTDWHVHEHYAPGFETKKVALPLAVFYGEVMYPESQEVDVEDILIAKDISDMTEGYLIAGRKETPERFLQLIGWMSWQGQNKAQKALEAAAGAEEAAKASNAKLDKLISAQDATNKLLTEIRDSLKASPNPS